MGDKPIIFSAPMVRALLDGRKSQTRRVLKVQPPEPCEFAGFYSVPLSGAFQCRFHGDTTIYTQRLPYAIGDRLYVREAHSLPLSWTENPNAAYIGHVFYPASVDAPFRSPYLREKPSDHGRLRPSIHMPRWASRLTLTVTDVRVQRLQEISDADAVAEGVEPLHTGFFPYGITTFMTTFIGDREVPAQCCRTARHSYEMLWDSLHGPDAWDANPWVVAVSFTVQHGNIDQIGGTHD